MDLSDWLLALHVSGAFLFLGGGVLAAAFNVAAQRSERPSEIALFYGLTRIAVVMIAFGALMTLVLGFWLVSDQDFSFSDLWVVLSLILWFVAIGMGQAGGMRDRATRELAEELAASAERRHARAPRPHARHAHARALVRQRARGRRRARADDLEARLMIASSANAQLFLHVLGAIALFGATISVAVLAGFGRNREEQLPLARASFFILLAARHPVLGRHARVRLLDEVDRELARRHRLDRHRRRSRERRPALPARRRRAELSMDAAPRARRLGPERARHRQLALRRRSRRGVVGHVGEGAELSSPVLYKPLTKER